MATGKILICKLDAAWHSPASTPYDNEDAWDTGIRELKDLID